MNNYIMLLAYLVEHFVFDRRIIVLIRYFVTKHTQYNRHKKIGRNRNAEKKLVKLLLEESKKVITKIDTNITIEIETK